MRERERERGGGGGGSSVMVECIEGYNYVLIISYIRVGLSI